MNGRMATGATGLLTKLIAGSPERKTRFHDQLGSLIPMSRAMRNAPHALVSGILRLTVGYRPERPWISYDAQAVIDSFLNPESAVLEFGSGMSTIWLSHRAGSVVSIEDNDEWFRLVGDRLRKARNIDYRLAGDRAAYVKLAPEKLYDLIVIDGSWREDCAAFAIRHLKPDGMIYLDNSDKSKETTITGDVPQARSIIMKFADESGIGHREFVDFAPTQLFVQRGLMVGPPG